MVNTTATPILRDLHIFSMTAETQNFSATAETFGMTPAAISKSIKRLEAIYGTKLFDRAGRGLTLTMAGQALRKRSKSVDQLLNVLRTDVNDAKAASSDLVRLGVSMGIVAEVVNPAIAKLISSSPTMQIEVSTHPSERLLEDLRDGVTDMALALAPADISSDLRFDKLGTTQHFVVARRGHPILRRPFTLEDLSRQKWIAAPWDAKWITDHFESNGLPAPTFSVRTNGPSIIFTGVLANSDLLTATDPALLSPRVAAALAMLPAPAPRRNPQYGLFWRKEAVFSPAMKRCRTELTRAFRKR